MITVVPAATDVTRPLELMVATEGSLEVQGSEAAGVPLEERVDVSPRHKLLSPERTGFAHTVTEAVASVRVPASGVPVAVAVLVNWPACTSARVMVWTAVYIQVSPTSSNASLFPGASVPRTGEASAPGSVNAIEPMVTVPVLDRLSV